MREDPYPLVGDDLIGSLLYRVHAQHRQVPFALGGVCGLALRAGGGTAGVPRGSEVIKVQVLLIGQALFLQSLIQNVRMIPYLRTENSSKTRPGFVNNDGLSTVFYDRSSVS